MVDILHRLDIAAPPAEVYESFTTLDGLQAWWTRTTTGDPTLGGQLSFFFGSADPAAVMEVTDLDVDRHVGWRCVAGADEWIGTAVTFDLEPVGDQTVLRFAHAGWREPTDFMGQCTTNWGMFLLGLQARLAGGEATPFTGEVAIPG
jgi:uncharacterized protein YndB with AHSA1/START domain